MGIACQNKCDYLPNVTKGLGGKRLGKKVCTICEIKIMTDESKCPCCNYLLRAKLRSSTAKTNAMKRQGTIPSQ